MIVLRWTGAALMALLWAMPAAAAPADDAFIAWARTHAVALPACSSIRSGGDYDMMTKAVGDARVVALGEPAHGAREPLALRNCFFRYLVEERGFTAIALETGFHESRRLRDYVAGGSGDARELARTGFTWGFGRYAENVELLEWIRAYNLDPANARKIAFYGIDMSGGDADGAWARARITLDAGIAYLARAAPARSAHAREEVAPFLENFSAPGYRALTASERARLRRSIVRLLHVFDSDRKLLVAASSRQDFDWARQNVVGARQLVDLFDVSGVPDPQGRLLPDDYRADAARDAAMAANALWALDQEGRDGRILLFAHNGHVMNAHGRGGIWAVYARPPAAMGVHLRRALGRDLVIFGSSSSMRDEGTGAPGTLDTALAKAGPENFMLDMRSSSGAPARWLSREQSMSVNYSTENLVQPRRAFDLLLYFGRMTRSDPERP